MYKKTIRQRRSRAIRTVPTGLPPFPAIPGTSSPRHERSYIFPFPFFILLEKLTKKLLSTFNQVFDFVLDFVGQLLASAAVALHTGG